MEKILEQRASEAYITDMARYSIIANLKRAIPDVKDGFKPVQRRIIYAMDAREHAIDKGSKVKSASIVGTVMKWYHPHSDSSIYDAMKPMANSFECKVPLIQPGGSFGNIMGGRAAASRYTEANLTQFALECAIGGLHYSDALVDWIDNYSNKCKEPEYLPVTVPLLLVNGADGIGVGVKVSIPTHNLGEVIDATIRLIDNPNADVILIPDHCIPCEIIDTDWKMISNTGNGSYKARGHITVSENKKGNPVLTITSLPRYNTDIVKNQIEDLVAAGKLPQIQDVLDESKINIKITVTLKKGSDAEFVKDAIYKYTDCERPFSVNFEAIDGVEKLRFSYKSYLESFIQFAMVNKFRFCCARLADINTRMHKLEAFIKVMRSGYIDKIIEMIKKRKEMGDNELIEFIISKANVTDLQAEFIINASLKQLSIGYLRKYEEDFTKLNAEMSGFEAMITNDDLIKDAVRTDLLNAKKKYATPRICNVIKVSNFGNIPQGRFKMVVTENNYIRKLGEQDVVNTIKGDKPKFILPVVENTECILLFDTKGRVFKLPIHKIPVVGRSDAGISLRTVIKGLTADVVSVMYEPWIKKAAKVRDKLYVAVLSRGNVIKKLDINTLTSVPPSGIIYSKVNETDDIISVQIVSDKLDVVVYSGHKALRMSAKEIPVYQRNSLGVAAMNTKDPIEGMSIIYPEATDVVVTTKSGKVNRFSVAGLAQSSRNKAGVGVIKLGKTDSIHSIYGAIASNVLCITTTSDVIKVPVESITPGSSVSQGIKTISTKTDIIIKSEIA